MRYHLVDRVNCVFHILIAHAMKHRQTDQPLVGIFRHRIVAAPVTETLPVVGVAMHRNVMHIDPDILRPQGAENFAAAGVPLVRAEPNRIKMPRRVGIVTDGMRKAGGATN